MHPSMRLLSLERSSLKGTRPLYICLNCRHETPTHARPFIQQIRPNSSSASLTERVRRKLWGTENPPGLKDPYGGKGVFESKWGRGQADGEEGAGGQMAEAQRDDGYQEGELAPPDEYVAATMWDDLKRIGHLGKWSDYPATEADEYQRFLSNTRVYGKAVDAAAHQAAIEISLLSKLNKPTTSACRVIEHENTIRQLLQSCWIKPGAESWGAAVVFPKRRTKEILLYVFNQIGDLGGKKPVEGKRQQKQKQKQKQGVQDLGKANLAVDELNKLSFDDPAIRFAFMKRFSQLSGHLLPDPLIHSASTVDEALQFVHNVLTPKPKLANQLAKDGTLRELPNVNIINRRHRKEDVDEQMGRKKVIDAVLRERGLLA